VWVLGGSRAEIKHRGVLTTLHREDAAMLHLQGDVPDRECRPALAGLAAHSSGGRPLC
jgi:hypothetical protein